MGLVTLIFDRLILKVVCDSRLSCGTVFPNFGTLGLRVLELFAITRRTDRRTDGRTYKSNAYCPFPTAAGHNNAENTLKLCNEI